ncbi:unannotated protein [freshwater metagenome]|uniref:Unannotated protein n=2 Tax=freshwater metagenome TaxID=449393 RepID=A0A6J7VMN0_9ZZZZ
MREYRPQRSVSLDRLLMRNRRLPVIGAVVAVAVVVVALAIISTRGASTSQAASRDSGEATTADSAGAATTSSVTPVLTTTPEPTGPYTTPMMPMSVSVSKTSGLHSGDVVSVTATPSNGSQAFGVEARLCRGDASIQFDGQMLPTRAGLCISKPFSDGTDSFIEVLNKPPYGPIVVTFRVGTGSQTFGLQDGTQSTITCDATHPCQLVLKMQYPNGFGFQGFPLVFG